VEQQTPQPQGVPVSTPPPGWDEPSPPEPAPAPSPDPGRTHRWRRPIWLGAATAGALAAILIISLRGGDAGVTPLSPVAAAAEQTAATPGGRVSGTGAISVDGRSLTMLFSGEFTADERRSSMRIDFASSVAPPGALDQLSPMLIVGEGSTVYMTAPIFSSQLPEGKTWMKIDYSGFAGAAAQQSSVDAQAMLDQLRSANPDVSEVGSERVRGVVTTRYAATIESDDAEFSSVGVWIDRRGYVRRETMTVPFNIVGGPSARMAMQMDFYDFGIEPQIGIPAEGESFDATELALQQLEATPE
jgi:hypothetical protein